MGEGGVELEGGGGIRGAGLGSRGGVVGLGWRLVGRRVVWGPAGGEGAVSRGWLVLGLRGGWLGCGGRGGLSRDAGVAVGVGGTVVVGVEVVGAGVLVEVLAANAAAVLERVTRRSSVGLCDVVAGDLRLLVVVVLVVWREARVGGGRDSGSEVFRRRLRSSLLPTPHLGAADWSSGSAGPTCWA